jgi:hypothetical protein
LRAGERGELSYNGIGPSDQCGVSSMSYTIEAISENGVLKPVQPLPLQEHERAGVRRASPE